MKRTDLPRGFTSNRQEDKNLPHDQILPRSLFGDTIENLRRGMGEHLEPIKSIGLQKNNSLNKRVIAVVDSLLTPEMNEIHLAESDQINALRAKQELLRTALRDGVYGVDANGIKELLLQLLEFQEAEKGDTVKDIRTAFRHSLGQIGVTNRSEYDDERYGRLMTELPSSLDGDIENYHRYCLNEIVDDPNVIMAITEGQNLDKSKVNKSWAGRINNTVSARKGYISMVGDMLFTGEEYTMEQEKK